MPKKMLWTELLLGYFPINKQILWQQMFARFCLLFSVWLTGLLVYALDGLMVSYVSELHFYPVLFGMGLLILFGTYMTQRTLSDLVQSVRPMLKLNDTLFRKFNERVQRYSYSFLPCLLLAMGLIVFTSGAPSEIQQALAEGFRLHVVWNLFFYFFIYLLVATGIWLFVSIWLTIFLISRQPLSVKLWPKAIEKFRDLSIVALWVSFGYFLGLSLSFGLTTLSAGAPAMSLLEIAISPNVLFIIIGIIGILLPFYNIHKTLLKLKKQELLKISEESDQLLRQLDEVLVKQPTRHISDQTIAIMARLFSLQFKERNIEAAQEWPIDISFLSKLAGLVFIPIISRIAMHILSQYL